MPNVNGAGVRCLSVGSVRDDYDFVFAQTGSCNLVDIANHQLSLTVYRRIPYICIHRFRLKLALAS